MQNRVEDLRELEDLTGTEDFLVGKICIARYGKIYRGNKVHNCQNKGALGRFACPENKYLQLIISNHLKNIISCNLSYRNNSLF